MFITRNVVRYVLLSYCIALRTVSFKLKKRFPSLDHLVLTGVMREDELRLFRQLDDKVDILCHWTIFHVISCWLYLKVSANKWFLPLNWASDILKLALKEDMIPKQCIGGSQLMNLPVTDYCIPTVQLQWWGNS